jgi:hypothetical protein
MTGPDNPTGPTGPGRLPAVEADVVQALLQPSTERVVYIFDAPRPGPGYCWPTRDRMPL